MIVRFPSLGQPRPSPLLHAEVQHARGSRAQRLAICLSVLIAFEAASVRAQATCNGPVPSGEARISLQFEDPEQATRLAEATLDALRATLFEGVSACMASEVETHTVTATLHVRPAVSSVGEADVTLEIADRATEKSLSRHLPLETFPADSRALALAVALDELLRASWLELSLAQARERHAQAPAVVQQVARTEVEKAVQSSDLRPRDGDAGAAAYFAQVGVRAFAAGEAWFGPDLGLSMPLPARWTVTATIGARQGLFHRSELGRVRLIGAASSVLGQRRLVDRTDYDLTLDLGVAVLVAQVGAIAANASADDRTPYARNTVAAWGAVQGGTTATLALTDNVRLRLAVALGLSVFPIIVSEGSEPPTLDTRGVFGALSLGVEVRP